MPEEKNLEEHAFEDLDGGKSSAPGKTPHQRAFLEFAERAREELGDSLLRLILFGSVARGEEGEFSDVDVFVVVETEGEKERVYEVASDVALERGVHIAPVVRTEEEFEMTRSTSFTEEVLGTGRAAV